MKIDEAVNYVDPAPPLPADQLGWGLPEHSMDERLGKEGESVDQLEIVVTASEATALNVLPEVEARIRAEFKFDAGWDFRVAERMVYGEDLTFFQNIGNCVGASHCMLLASRIAHEVLLLGEAEDPLGRGQLSIPFVPYSYGVGRLAGNMLGGGDGSYCGAQIDGSETYGFLPCFTPGLDAYVGTGSDGPPQGTARAGRDFGGRRSILESWMPQAKTFDLEEAPVCESADECWTLVVEKRVPLQICSGWGFAFGSKDSNGINVYRASGSWSHSMQVVAAFEIKGQRYVTVRNQWGKDAHKDGQSFTIMMETFNAWVRQAECIGIGAVKGLAANPGF